MTEFGVVTLVGRSVFIGVGHALLPSSPKIFESDLLRTPKRFDLERRNLVW